MNLTRTEAHRPPWRINRKRDLAPLAELPTHYVKTITVLDDNGFAVRTVDILVRKVNP